MCCEEKQLRDVIFEVYYNLQIREAWADKVASKLLFKNDLYHREDQTMFVCFSSKTYICASKWIRNNAHSSIAYNRQYVPFIAKSWLSLLQLCGLWSTRLLCPWDFPGKNTRVGCHSFSKGASWPRDQTHVSCIGKQILYCWATREAPYPEF